ncbi:hypothetical protein K4L44_04820 [Halosquirtibacter laminarini]|uniref:Uncharacterized protein n=1 Tax=Halosquirtibacter laminarini TaxID=3374600 RepID=A0AC61NHY6_9BACT|nr:hypothetical protein K4L44_04820 [Prolixibacteraceae bacterium]
MEFLKLLHWKYIDNELDKLEYIPEPLMVEFKYKVLNSRINYSLQPFRILEISTNEIKNQIKAFVYNALPMEYSHVFVVTIPESITRDNIRDYIQHFSETNNVFDTTLKQFEESLTHWVEGMSSDELERWIQQQIYITLGVVLESARELGLVVHPVEEYDNSALDEILGLRAHAECSKLMLVVCGKKTDDDNFAASPFLNPIIEEL